MTMWKLKMENLTITSIMLSFVTYYLECAVVEGKVLDPIYWNSSNPMFKSQGRGRQTGIHAAINDKLDIICPRRGRDDGEDLFYFKLFLVSEENYRKCNATGGRRLITCDVPEQEKKYTFYFQEISPSPWGLEFDPEKSYYVVSTSDGTKSGINGLKGGVCTRFNMKIEMKIHIAEKPNIATPSAAKHPPANNDQMYSNSFVDNQGSKKDPVNPLNHQFIIEDGETDKADQGKTPSTKVDHEEDVSSTGIIVGIVLGACAVAFVVLLIFLGYRLHKRRRRVLKKYQSSPMTPTRGNTPVQQVTLVPIAPPSHHNHHHHRGRLRSDQERLRSTTLSSHTDLLPPPSYNETFLDNGGPVVAV